MSKTRADSPDLDELEDHTYDPASQGTGPHHPSTRTHPSTRSHPSAPNPPSSRSNTAQNRSNPVQNRSDLPQTRSKQLQPSQVTSGGSSNTVSSQTAQFPAPQPPKPLHDRLTDPPAASTSHFRSQHRSKPSRSLLGRISASPAPSDNAREAEAVRAAAEAMESVLEQYRNQEIDTKQAFRAFQDHSRGDPTVVEDYVQQMLQVQRDEIDFTKQKKAVAKEKQRQQDSPEQVTALEAARAAAWAVMERELAENDALLAAVNGDSDEIEIEQPGSGTVPAVASFLAQPTTSSSSKVLSGLPVSLLEAAPHLAALTTTSPMPSHVQSTWDLRLQFTLDTNVDATLSLLSAQLFADPLPQSLLRLIIKDKYVDFEKIHAAVNGFSFLYDDSKDFGTEYKLVRKEQSIKSLPVTTESQWLRVFEAWLVPLLKIYPNRQSELTAYKAQIQELFRVTPTDPSLGIRVDREARQKASNTPFDLGNSESLRLLVLKEMLSATSKKRPAPASSTSSSRSPQKRHDTPCILWNDDRCSEPCPNNRKHGHCSECGEAHRAINNQSCYSKLTERRRNSGRNRPTRS
jgi:hypothetical protein